MRSRRALPTAVLCLALAAIAVGAGAAETASAEPRLVATIALPNVRGRIDHLAIDQSGGRLFVAALGNDTVEVLDLRAGAPSRSISGLREPQGVLFLPDRHQLYVANGGDGVCDVFDADTLARVRAIDLSADADNLRWDGRDATVYVANGAGALSRIDAASGVVSARIALAAHPESFQLEEAGPRIFVNLPAARQIAVVDRQRRTVVASWPLVDARANYPMALDEGHRRLLVGTRQPPRLDVYDIDSGTRIAALPSVGDMDDLFVDARRGRVYAIGGEGRADILARAEGDRYQRVAQIPTRAGARTGLWDPDSNRLYVALPRAGQQAAEIRVYDLPP
jgi:DNA-binding beta-propeller fold protein YncE